MIRYDLRCGNAHEFDGWFQDSDGFDRLRVAGLVECPVCGGTEIGKRLMTPAVPRKGRGRRDAAPLPDADTMPGVPPAPELPASGPAPMPGPNQAVAGRLPTHLPPNLPPNLPPHLPPQVQAVLQRMRAEVEARCDYVGRDFAAEARRMHRGESERVGIYGEATAEEAESLAEDGIEVGRIPWVPRADG